MGGLGFRGQLQKPHLDYSRYPFPCFQRSMGKEKKQQLVLRYAQILQAELSEDTVAESMLAFTVSFTSRKAPHPKA